MSRHNRPHKKPQEPKQERDGHLTATLPDGEADWNDECSNCGASPTVSPTGLCGPCCFGEADTVGGNW